MPRRSLQKDLKGVWNAAVDAMKTLSKTDPKFALYSAAAVAVYLVVELELRNTWENPKETPNTIAEHMTEKLFVSPWFPVLVGLKLVEAGIEIFPGDPPAGFRTIFAQFLVPYLRRDWAYKVLQHGGDLGAKFSWRVPAMDRTLLAVQLAIVPLFGVEAFAQVLRGVGEITPG